MDVPAAAGGLAVARLGARAPMLNVKHHMRTSRSVTSTAPMSPDSPLSILPDLWHPPYELHRQRAARFALALPLRGGSRASCLCLPAYTCLPTTPAARPSAAATAPTALRSTVSLEGTDRESECGLLLLRPSLWAAPKLLGALLRSSQCGWWPCSSAPHRCRCR